MSQSQAHTIVRSKACNLLKENIEYAIPHPCEHCFGCCRGAEDSPGMVWGGVSVWSLFGVFGFGATVGGILLGPKNFPPVVVLFIRRQKGVHICIRPFGN